MNQRGLNKQTNKKNTTTTTIFTTIYDNKCYLNKKNKTLAQHKIRREFVQFTREYAHCKQTLRIQLNDLRNEKPISNDGHY